MRSRVPGVHWLRWVVARLRGDVLTHPLADADDDEIDAALAKRGFTRADLFSTRRAVARHRVRMAAMLAARQIDVARAVAEHWPELKAADQACSRCRHADQCHRWLPWGRPDAAPRLFCPNADLFARIARL